MRIVVHLQYWTDKWGRHEWRYHNLGKELSVNDRLSQKTTSCLDVGNQISQISWVLINLYHSTICILASTGLHQIVHSLNCRPRLRSLDKDLLNQVVTVLDGGYRLFPEVLLNSDQSYWWELEARCTTIEDSRICRKVSRQQERESGSSFTVSLASASRKGGSSL